MNSDRPPTDIANGGNAAWERASIPNNSEPIFESDAGLARSSRSGSTAIAGFVLGVLSVLVAFFLPVSPIFSIFLSIVGVICSWLGRRSQRRGLANAGLVLASISLLFVVVASLCVLGEAMGRH